MGGKFLYINFYCGKCNGNRDRTPEKYLQKVPEMEMCINLGLYSRGKLKLVFKS